MLENMQAIELTLVSMLVLTPISIQASALRHTLVSTLVNILASTPHPTLRNTHSSILERLWFLSKQKLKPTLCIAEYRSHKLSI